jgi:predicted transcriptional regulator
MGYELWISPNTGILRKGTTFKELQSLFIDNITTKYIFEPIYSCKRTDNSEDVRETLEKREFDIVGVTDENRKIVGYAKRTELNNGLVEQFTYNIDLNQVISDSTPISQLLNIFSENSFVFVLKNNLVNGIVTRADINKPIVRIYLFGIISLFEMHLNFWINNYYKNDSWTEIIKKERLDEAIKIYELRKGKNEDLSLLECIQLSDKKVILKSTTDFLKLFDLSKKQTERFLKDIEKIRNELAHSQNSIISNLEWVDFVNTISFAESFLIKSEMMVKEKTRTPNKGYTQ